MDALALATKRIQLAALALDSARTSTIHALKELKLVRDEAAALLDFAEACHANEQEALRDLLTAIDMAKVAWEERGKS